MMMTITSRTLALSGLLLASISSLTAADPDPLQVPPPPDYAIGWPSRDSQLDALPGFRTPPPGYGEVGFYWWMGDPLTKERLTYQLDRLSGMGVMGLQINYAHSDVGGNSFGLTYPSDPPLFSEAWWKLVEWFAAEAKKRGMAISLSDYTLGSYGQGRWMDEIIAEIPDLHGSQLQSTAWTVASGKELAVEVPEQTVALSAWKVEGETAVAGSLLDLRSKLQGRSLHWTATEGNWRVIAVASHMVPTSVDPLDLRLGPKVVEKFFQRFENHLPGEGGKALNFFFSDELSFGIGGHLWHQRFAGEFQKRKGYDLVPELPALFADLGPRTAKIRLDFNDVMVALEEEAFFKPLFLWHQQRGMIFGCDHGGRGSNVLEFGDYFRTQRWMQGPGNDQPGLGRAVSRTKVHSSIAHLYQRPRVWLEGYYGSGWGTTPSQLVTAGVENYCLGSSLQTFHGLYYTTHGGWWEWAPPCNHFRMPYWDHMKSMMTWMQRLCYLLSQGTHRCDVAVLYPVAPMQVDPARGQKAVAAALGIAPQIYDRGIDCDFIDDQSLERATIEKGELRVSGEAYRVLVLPAMSALHHSTLIQAQRFAKAGGLVLAVGALPEASDRVGSADAELDAIVKEMFGLTAAELKAGAAVPDPAGRHGIFLPTGTPPEPVAKNAKPKSRLPGVVLPDLPELISHAIQRDFIPARPVTHVLHRVVGSRDVFLVTQAQKGDDCFFRASGKVELWDPWTGTTEPILAVTPVEGGTRVKLPKDALNGLVIVFSPGTSDLSIVANDLDEVTAVTADNGAVTLRGYAATAGPKTARVKRGETVLALAGEAPAQPEPVKLDDAWEFSLQPTCDNRFGDFRLPAFDGFIGAEARRFHYADETAPNPGWEAPGFKDTAWPQTTHGFGPRFWKLGPVPAGPEADALEAQLAALTAIDPAKPVTVAGKSLRWQPYAFSWREGIEGDPGHQGYHGLKENVSDDFIGLGKPGRAGHPEFRSGNPSYVPETEGESRYYLWSSLVAAKAGPVRVLSGELKPTALWLGGTRQAGDVTTATLKAGTTSLLAVFGKAGRTHLVFQAADAPAEPTRQTPLAMRWYDLAGVLPYELQPERSQPAGWYRFTAPPGLKSMTVTAQGQLQAWLNGRSCQVEKSGTHRDGAQIFKVTVTESSAELASVALRVAQVPGNHAGGAITEPVALDCGPGKLAVGDWAQIDSLSSYSGSAWYRRTVVLTPTQLAGRVTLRLGAVAASAKVTINGTVAGTLVAPPWDLDVTRLVKEGENRIEIQVCNTLANHYQTIPTHYRGSPVSGLIGPVSLTTERPVELKSAKP